MQSVIAHHNMSVAHLTLSLLKPMYTATENNYHMVMTTYVHGCSLAHFLLVQMHIMDFIRTLVFIYLDFQISY